jgi:hypothetical protein
MVMASPFAWHRSILPSKRPQVFKVRRNPGQPDDVCVDGKQYVAIPAGWTLYGFGLP